MKKLSCIFYNDVVSPQSVSAKVFLKSNLGKMKAHTPHKCKSSLSLVWICIWIFNVEFNENIDLHISQKYDLSLGCFYVDWFSLVWFYGISTNVGHLMPNSFRYI